MSLSKITVLLEGGGERRNASALFIRRRERSKALNRYT